MVGSNLTLRRLRPQHRRTRDGRADARRLGCRMGVRRPRHGGSGHLGRRRRRCRHRLARCAALIVQSSCRLHHPAFVLGAWHSASPALELRTQRWRRRHRLACCKGLLAALSKQQRAAAAPEPLARQLCPKHRKGLAPQPSHACGASAATWRCSRRPRSDLSLSVCAPSFWPIATGRLTLRG